MLERLISSQANCWASIVCKWCHSLQELVTLKGFSLAEVWSWWNHFVVVCFVALWRKRRIHWFPIIAYIHSSINNNWSLVQFVAKNSQLCMWCHSVKCTKIRENVRVGLSLKQRLQKNCIKDVVVILLFAIVSKSTLIASPTPNPLRQHATRRQEGAGYFV